MRLGEVLDKTRGIYVDKFLDVARAYPSAVTEAAYRDQNGDLVRDGVLDLPARLDLLTGDGRTIGGDSDRSVVFPPFSMQWVGQAPVRFSPFDWSCVCLACEGISPDADFEPLRRWFLHWFDVSDKNLADADGLFGVVHGLSDPTRTERGIMLVADLGTACIDVVEDLLDALFGCGAGRVDLS